MIPASFPEENRVLNKPAGMSDDECAPLSVCCTYQGDMPVVVSCWKLTQEDLDHILKHKRVWLTVYGPSMPPVYLSGKRPFVDEFESEGHCGEFET